MSNWKPPLRRPFKLAFFLSAVFLAFLACLAVLQFLWIGEVTEAERQRMEDSVRLATSRFAEEFNGEVMRTLLPLLLPQSSSFSGGLNSFGGLYLQWRATSAYPEIVQNVFAAEIPASGEIRLSRFNTQSRLLEPMEWPDRMRDVKTRLISLSSDGQPNAPFRSRSFDLFLPSEPPTAVAPVFPWGPGERFPIPLAPGSPAKFVGPESWVIVEFNPAYIVEEVFPDFIERYFSALGEGDYRIAVITQGKDAKVIYESDPALSVEELNTADARADLFGSGRDRFVRSAGRPPIWGQDRFSVPTAAGHWQLLVKHRLGSLDVVAKQFYRRNLAVSFGIMLVLLGSIVMIVVGSERARRLARLQMEFAAGISHELRTPLAVIQALTYNLATGIVKDPEHVDQYARMVQQEARDLSSMVDEVLLFAETQSTLKKFDLGSVEISEVVDRALATLTSQIEEDHCEICVDVPDDLPNVRANAGPLMHCLRNLVCNALKYGRDSKNVSNVCVVATSIPEKAEVEISVVDRGLGIDPDDLPHIFEPFYRGRTVSPGVRGAGLGLHLVKRLMEAQEGRVTVESVPGAGSQFTLHIPVFKGQQLTYGPPAVSG